MHEEKLKRLSKREREVLEIIYQRGHATAVEIHKAMHDAPSYSAVRGMLRVLEEKGMLTHSVMGKRNLYVPTVHTGKAGKWALKNLVQTFFGGSPEKAVATLIDISKADLSDKALERLAATIEKAKKEGH